MAAKDARTLVPVKNAPGIYRRHAGTCKRNGRCSCPYVVRWKAGGTSLKMMFPTLEQAREHKRTIGPGHATRRPLSRETLAGYYAGWIEGYRGRTARGLEESTRREYEMSFRLHILPLAIGRTRMRDLVASDVAKWLVAIEGRGASPTTIRKAKAALSVMLASAAEADDIGSNPAVGVRYVPTKQAKARHPARKRRALTAKDVVAILTAMPEGWRAFFTLLAQTGVRISELLGLTWGNIHLGDDPHIMVAEQVYRGERKQLKTDASKAQVPLSASMASWLAELRPEDVSGDAPVFASATGTPLNYSNVYHRVLRPALERSGVAVQTGTVTVRRRGQDAQVPVFDYQGVAFHAFRKACGSLLFAHGKSLKQVQGWLRHSQLTTTMNVYINQVDDGLGSADAWDDILGDTRGHPGATEHPETAANEDPGQATGTATETASQSHNGLTPAATMANIRKQPQTF
jgi:integrase